MTNHFRWILGVTMCCALLSKVATADYSLFPWVGPGIAYFRSSTSGEGSARLNLAAGVQIEKAIHSTVRLTLEPRFNPQGVKSKVIFGLTGDVAVEYFETAVLASISILGSSHRVPGDWQLQVVSGAFFGIAVRREIELLSLVKVDLKDRFSGSNFGLELGLLSDYWIMRGVSIRVGARFLLGLTDISLLSTESYSTRELLLSFGVNWVL